MCMDRHQSLAPLERFGCPPVDRNRETTIRRAVPEVILGTLRDLWGSLAQMKDKLLKPCDDPREFPKADLLWRVSRGVIPRIPERRRVGYHDAGISLLPECPVIRPTQSGNPSRSRHPA